MADFNSQQLLLWLTIAAAVFYTVVGIAALQVFCNETRIDKMTKDLTPAQREDIFGKSAEKDAQKSNHVEMIAPAGDKKEKL